MRHYTVVQERRQSVLNIGPWVVQITTRLGDEEGARKRYPRLTNPVYGYWFIRFREGGFEEHQGDPAGYASHDEAFADLIDKISARIDELEDTSR